MGLGVISANVSTKVSGAVSNTRTTTGTLHTCAANSYAIVNVFVESNGGTISILVDSREVATYSGGATGASTSGAQMGLPSIFVGPSQVLSCSIGTSGEVHATGVEFINSP